MKVATSFEFKRQSEHNFIKIRYNNPKNLERFNQPITVTYLIAESYVKKSLGYESTLTYLINISNRKVIQICFKKTPSII